MKSNKIKGIFFKGSTGIIIYFLLIITPAIFIVQSPLYPASILLNNNTTIEGRITQETKGTVTVQEPRTNKVYNLKRNEIKLITRDADEVKDLERIRDVYSHIITLKKNKDLNWTQVKPDKKDEKGNIQPTVLYVTIVEKGVNSTTVLDYEANIKVKILNDNIEEMVDIAKIEEMKKKKEQEEEREYGTASVAGRHKLRIGILPGASIPSGALSGAIGMGMGGSIFGDWLFFGKSYLIRGGIQAGYASFSSTSEDKTASLTIIPVLFYGHISYPSKIGLKPYLSLGLGATMASVSGQYEEGTKESFSESSTDATFSVGAGTGYSHRSMPRVEFILGASYIMEFQTVTGSFINLSLGAAYNF